MHWYLNFFEKFNQTLYLFSRSFAPDSRFSEFSTDCSKVLETIEKTTIIKPQSSTTNEGSRFSEFSLDCSKVLETIEKTIIIKPQSSTTNKIKKKIKMTAYITKGTDFFMKFITRRFFLWILLIFRSCRKNHRQTNVWKW